MQIKNTCVCFTRSRCAALFLIRNFSRDCFFHREEPTTHFWLRPWQKSIEPLKFPQNMYKLPNREQNKSTTKQISQSIFLCWGSQVCTVRGRMFDTVGFSIHVITLWFLNWLYSQNFRVNYTSVQVSTYSFIFYRSTIKQMGNGYSTLLQSMACIHHMRIICSLQQHFPNKKTFPEIV